MTYTKEEQDQLIKNAYKIQEWIDEHCDNLRDDFQMRFGNMKEFNRIGERIQPEYEFKILGGWGYLHICKSSVAYYLDEWDKGERHYSTFNYFFALCENWKAIKEEILIQLERESKVNSAINDFEV